MITNYATSRKVIDGTSRAGFSLVELVVVSAASALLGALVLPAVQQSRQVGRKHTCLNNLKQLALAAHNYHDVHKSLPSGYILKTVKTDPHDIQDYMVTFPRPIQTPRNSPSNKVIKLEDWTMSPSWGWHAMLLPQIGWKDTVNFRESKSSRHNLGTLAAPGVIRREVKLYVCPDTGLPDLRPEALGFTTYRGVTGTTLTNGVLFGDTGVRMADITDGLSFTILFGESQFGFWGDAQSCCARVADDNNDDLPDRGAAFDTYIKVNAVHVFGLGSWHDKSCNIAFVDGKVKSVNKDIEFSVLKALATRAGGEELRDGDF